MKLIEYIHYLMKGRVPTQNEMKGIIQALFFLEPLHEFEMDEISSDNLSNILGNEFAGSSYSSSCEAFRKCKLIFDKAVTEGIIVESPFDNLMSKNISHRYRTITPDEEAGVIDVLKKTDMMPMFLFGRNTGLGRGYAMSLKISDIDFNNKTVNINGRDLSLTDKAWESVMMQLEMRIDTGLDTEYFFTGRNNCKINVGAFKKLSRYIQIASKVTDFSYELYAKQFYAAENNVKKIDSKNMGMEDLCKEFLKYENSSQFSECSWTRMRSEINCHILPFFSNYPLEDLNMDLFCKFFKESVSQNQSLKHAQFAWMVLRNIIIFGQSKSYCRMNNVLLNSYAQMMSLTGSSMPHKEKTIYISEGVEDIVLTRYASFFDVAERYMYDNPEIKRGFRCKLQKYFYPCIGSVEIQFVETHQINICLSKMKEDVTPDAYNFALYKLRRIFRFAYDQGLTDHKLYDKLKGIPARRKLPHRYSDETRCEIFRAIKKTDIYPMFLFAATTGINRQELLNLRWENCDFANSLLRLKNDRTMILPESAVRALAIQKNMSTSELIFAGRDGLPYKPHYILMQVSLVRHVSGVENFSLGFLRSQLLLYLLYSEMPLKEVFKYMGYQNSGSFTKYYYRYLNEGT